MTTCCTGRAGMSEAMSALIHSLAVSSLLTVQENVCVSGVGAVLGVRVSSFQVLFARTTLTHPWLLAVKSILSFLQKDLI